MPRQVHFWWKSGLYCQLLSQLIPLVMSDHYQYVDTYYRSSYPDGQSVNSGATCWACVQAGMRDHPDHQKCAHKKNNEWAIIKCLRAYVLDLVPGPSLLFLAFAVRENFVGLYL